MSLPPETEGFLLSPQQRRVWALQRRRAEPLAAQAVVVVGGMSAGELRRRLEREVERWEVLRTGFGIHSRFRLPVQTVLAPALSWQVLAAEPGDLTGAVRRAAAEDRAAIPLYREAAEAFQPPLRATLVAGEGEARLILTLPALCADARTLVLLVQALLRGEESAAEALQYADLADWLNEMVSGEDGEVGRRYWRERGIGPGLTLRLPFGRPETAGGPMMPVMRSLPVPLAADGATAAVALAAWRALLLRLTGGETSVVAVAFDGRDYDELREAPGPVQRSLPVGGELAADLTFRGLVEETAGELARCAEWQHAFCWEWFAADASDADADPPALPFAFAAHAVPGEIVELAVDGEEYHVRLSCLESPAGLSLRLDYDAARFSEASMARLAEELAALLAHGSAAPHLPVGDLDCVGPAERHALLAGFNSTPAPRPAAGTLHGLIARSADAAPDAVAAWAGGESLTYGELQTRAHRLARWLKSRGVARGDVVALALPRGLDLLTAILAVLEAGAAYLPLDPSYPPERTAFVLSDARPALVVSAGDIADSAAQPPIPLLPQTEDAGPDDLAYVLYTSGSTGRPKGILIPHRAVVGYVTWAASFYGAGLGIRGMGAPVHSSMGFDLTVTSLFTPLVSGRAVRLLEDGLDTGRLIDELAAGAGYSLVKLTPAHLDLLRQRMPPETVAPWAATLVVGGEALQGERLRFWRANAPDLRIVNEYGPTEATVGCSFHEVPPGAALAGPVPIGRPAGGMRLYVLDRGLRLVPTGVAGEICVGGPGLAWGYLGRPDLTAERFVPDPFAMSAGAGMAGERLYRTGDLGRHGENGELEFLGRIDTQVKVDGYRVELGEIEAALLRHPAVAEAAAALVGAEGTEPRLVGYVRLGGAAMPAMPAIVEEIRESLRAWLPPYMVPAVVVELPALPLNAHGKVDRRALPPPYLERDRFVRPSGPRDPLELELLRLFEEALALRPLGIDESFFDLGGNSLLAVRVLSQVHRRLGVDLPLSALFANSTVAALAALLRQGPEALERLRSPLVPLHSGGSRRPLFCVHPTGGNVLSYVALARHLGDDQPFYAIQDPRLYAPGPAAEVPALSVEAMARAYVAAMRGVQPRGPYLLAGWSSGGTVAFEMARQLLAVGERVRLLALLDSAVPFYAVRPPDAAPVPVDGVQMLASLSRILCRLLDREVPLPTADGLQAMTAEERMDHMLEVARATGFVPPDATRDQAVRLYEVFKANTAAVRAYRPAPLEQTLVLIRAADPLQETLRSPTLNAGLTDEEAYRWQRLTRRAVHARRVPGDHLTMMTGPRAAALARALRASIDEVQTFREGGWGVLSWGLGH